MRPMVAPKAKFTPIFGYCAKMKIESSAAKLDYKFIIRILIIKFIITIEKTALRRIKLLFQGNCMQPVVASTK